eukprot:jgi/Chlat1/5007/Chrsp32S04980
MVAVVGWGGRRPFRCRRLVFDQGLQPRAPNGLGGYAPSVPYTSYAAPSFATQAWLRRMHQASTSTPNVDQSAQPTQTTQPTHPTASTQVPGGGAGFDSQQTQSADGAYPSVQPQTTPQPATSSAAGNQQPKAPPKRVDEIMSLVRGWYDMDQAIKADGALAKTKSSQTRWKEVVKCCEGDVPELVSWACNAESCKQKWQQLRAQYMTLRGYVRESNKASYFECTAEMKEGCRWQKHLLLSDLELYEAMVSVRGDSHAADPAAP